MDILETACKNQEIAWEIIDQARIFHIWQEVGAEINLVGSLKTWLLMKHLDIDFHIYTDNLDIDVSFAAIRRLAENPSIKEIHYRNLAQTDEACIEWHLWYEDQLGRLWQLDMIHIRRGSAYDGVVERVTNEIIKKMKPELREVILGIKFNIPDDEKVPGIDIYRAVLSDGVRNFDEFCQWRRRNPSATDNLIMDWIPD